MAVMLLPNMAIEVNVSSLQLYVKCGYSGCTTIVQCTIPVEIEKSTWLMKKQVQKAAMKRLSTTICKAICYLCKNGLIPTQRWVLGASVIQRFAKNVSIMHFSEPPIRFKAALNI